MVSHFLHDTINSTTQSSFWSLHSWRFSVSILLSKPLLTHFLEVFLVQCTCMKIRSKPNKTRAHSMWHCTKAPLGSWSHHFITSLFVTLTLLPPSFILIRTLMFTLVPPDNPRDGPHVKIFILLQKVPFEALKIGLDRGGWEALSHYHRLWTWCRAA